jgi:hypothetical protein
MFATGFVSERRLDGQANIPEASGHHIVFRRGCDKFHEARCTWIKRMKAMAKTWNEFAASSDKLR